MHLVLGVDVDDHLLERWRTWYAPMRQPFRVDDLAPQIASQIPISNVAATAEWRDTFFLYGGTWTWLTEDEFESLPVAVRRALQSRRRTAMRPKPSPVWPSTLLQGGDDPLRSWVEAGVAPSEHAWVSGATWKHALRMLPGAVMLAGTFPSTGSGPNCFATVVAAADGAAVDVADQWMQIEDFEVWLGRRTVPWTGASRDVEPGTVLVWTEHGRLAHAAITLGDGWVLNKPSQSWSSPRLVWTVRRLVQSWRFPGTKLSRHVLTR